MVRELVLALTSKLILTDSNPNLSNSVKKKQKKTLNVNV